MKIINPYFSAIRQADKAIGDNLRAQVYKKKYLEDAKDYLNGTHTYKLMGNQKELGDKATMTGRQAKAQNQVFMDMYREDVRADIAAGVKFGKGSAVLKRWVVIERFISEKI